MTELKFGDLWQREKEVINISIFIHLTQGLWEITHFPLSFFFRAHLPDLIFLVVCSIYEKFVVEGSPSNGILFRTISYFLRKWQKRRFSSNLSHEVERRKSIKMHKSLESSAPTFFMPFRRSTLNSCNF